MKKSFIILLTSLFFLSSCAIFQDKKPVNATRYNPEILKILQKKKSYFPKLSKKEIKRRASIALPTFNGNWQDQKNVAVIVKNAIENSIKSKSDVIAIDLRYYKEIGLGNIIFSNIADKNLEDFKESSKFNQQFFILFNFSEEKISVSTGSKTPHQFTEFYIKGSIEKKEIIFNVSNAKLVKCNNKFTPKSPKISFIADNISKARCDIREPANFLQSTIYFLKTFNSDLFGRWQMNLISINNSNYAYDGGSPKFTGGVIKNTMNQDVKNLNMAVFKDMNEDGIKYYDNQGKKFKYATRFD